MWSFFIYSSFFTRLEIEKFKRYLNHVLHEKSNRVCVCFFGNSLMVVVIHHDDIFQSGKLCSLSLDISYGNCELIHVHNLLVSYSG